jgi:predicted homoserine dehydrogenase-like protein
MRVAAIFNRKPSRARDVFHYAGQEDVTQVETQRQLDQAINANIPAVTDDAFLLARSDFIDVIVDVTGSVEFGARVVLEAFKHRKPVVLMNAEIDATIGPILQVYARKYGVILSACDGDEPGVQMNLYRWVKGLGFIPRVIGNIKGLQDPYRNPTTQKGFAEQWGQNPAMVTSFADGSKISFEQAIVANATGFKVRSRGMSRGLEYRGDVMQIGKLYDIDEVRQLGGIIDYVVGTPLTKVYVLAEHTDPKQQRYLNLYKMGDGPLYPFFIPYHLVHFEVPNSIARAVLFRDSVAPALAGPVVEVCAVAKRDLKAGEILDDYGMYMTYGEAVNTDEMSKLRYLPEGLVEGCKLKRDIKKDMVLTYADVHLPAGRLADQLRAEQYRHFSGDLWLEQLLESTDCHSEATA